ncbi:hypothetical protein HOH51_02160 [bacterium]|nr:hypothetical protein [bacterium]
MESPSTDATLSPHSSPESAVPGITSAVQAIESVTSVDAVSEHITTLHKNIRFLLPASPGLHVIGQQGVYSAPKALERAGHFLNPAPNPGWNNYLNSSVISVGDFDLNLEQIGIEGDFFHVPTADLFFGKGGEAYRHVVNQDRNYRPFYQACTQIYASALQSLFKIGGSLSSVGSIVMVGPSAEELQLLLMSLAILQKTDDDYQSPTVYLSSQCPQELNSVLEVLTAPQEVTYNGGVAYSIPVSPLAKFNAILGDITQIQFLNPEHASQPDENRLSLECTLPSYHFYKGLTFGNFPEEEVFRLCNNVYGDGSVYFDGQERAGIQETVVTYSSFPAKKFVSTVPAMILNKMGVPNDLLKGLPLHVKVNRVKARNENTNKYAETIVHTMSLPDNILGCVRENFPDCPRDMLVSRSTRRNKEGLANALREREFNVKFHTVDNEHKIWGMSVSQN